MSEKNNMINICVDKCEEGEMSGRIYHCYDEQPWVFLSMVQMLNIMEKFFDELSFPQASTRTRTFVDKEHLEDHQLRQVLSQEEVGQQEGEVGTFLVRVKYRQNSSWQGKVRWVEQDKDWKFISTLELLKVLSNSLEA